MSKKLIIAEKPSLARDIAKALGISKKNKNGSFEEGDIIISALVGHIIESVYPRNTWSLDNLPLKFENITYKVSKGKNDIAKRIKSEITRSDVTEIVNAGDADPEGSLLVYELYDFFDVFKTNKKLTRMWMLAVDKNTIKKAYQDRFPQEQDMKFVNTAYARADADVEIGFNFTQLFTLKHGKPGETINIGRVMTPTMQIVRKRELDIEKFVPEEFFNVKGNFIKGDNNLEANLFVLNDEGKQTTAVKTLLYEPLKPFINKDEEYTIVSHKTKSENKKPDYLPNLNDILKSCGRLHKLSSKKITDIMQYLYENQFCTYPRSEIKFLPTAMEEDVKDTFNCYVSLKEQELNGEPTTFNIKNKRIFNDEKVESHFAIIPMPKSEKDINSLDDNHRKVFEYIVSKFLMAFMNDYKYNSTTIVLENNNHKEVKFKSSGKIETQKGFKNLDCVINRNPSKDVLLPDVNEGDILILNKITNKKEQTKPPSYLTEPDLLEIMGDVHKLYKKQAEEGLEKGEEVELEFDGNFSLGTSATRGAILEKLFTKKFLQKSGKKILTTELGRDLLNVVGDSIDISMTAKFEEDMANITSDKQNPEDFLNKIKKYVKEIIEKEKPNITYVSTTQKLETEFTCPKCGSEIIESGKSFRCKNTGKWDGKNKKWDGSCSFSLTKFIKPLNYTLTIEDYKKMVVNNETLTINNDKKVKLNLDNPFFIDIDYGNSGSDNIKRDTDLKCPKCKGNIIQSAKIYRCNNTGKWDGKNKKWDGNCDFHQWKYVKDLGIEITEEDLFKLLNGETLKNGDKSFSLN